MNWWNERKNNYSKHLAQNMKLEAALINCVMNEFYYDSIAGKQREGNKIEQLWLSIFSKRILIIILFWFFFLSMYFYIFSIDWII